MSKITGQDLESIKDQFREKIREHGTGVLSIVLDKAHNQLGQIRDKRIKISAEYAIEMLAKIEAWEKENAET